jgi:hypothetical protein
MNQPQPQPMPNPVPGQPFEPYCAFDLCDPDEPHTADCKSRGDRALQFKHEDKRK